MKLIYVYILVAVAGVSAANASLDAGGSLRRLMLAKNENQVAEIQRQIKDIRRQSKKCEAQLKAQALPLDCVAISRSDAERAWLERMIIERVNQSQNAELIDSIAARPELPIAVRSAAETRKQELKYQNMF